MTPEQIALVQASYVQLGPRKRKLAERFYERLFELEPSVRALFSQDPDLQEAVFASELATIVHSIPRFETFVVRVRDLGARHAAYGITYAHYEIAAGALLQALDDTLGTEFTDEMRDAWRLAFDLVAETMMQGAAEAVTAPAP